MSQSTGSKRGCVIAVVVLAAVVALAPIQTIRWSGGFHQTEFRLTFVDTFGRPVPGVTLRVETPAGGASYLFPIDEFLPHSAPTSDVAGRMTFHHASRTIFGGRVSQSLIGVQYGDFVSPQYVCVFSHGGREVGRFGYNTLQYGGETKTPPIDVLWKDTDWPQHEVAACDGDWGGCTLRLFDANRNGLLDPDERYAANYFCRIVEMPRTDKITFVVVERIISVP